MKWWRSLSFIHESRFIDLYSLLWSAKTPYKVCDTNITMTCFHKLTFNVFEPVLAVEWGANRHPSPLNSVFLVQILQLNVEF